MKLEDIDKKIGMPDIDTEWAKFEHEVIDPETRINAPRTKRGMIWKIAATVAIILCCSGVIAISANRGRQPEIHIEAGSNPVVRINRYGILLFSPAERDTIIYIQPAQLMNAIKEIDGNCVLTIEYDEAVNPEKFNEIKNMCRSNAKLRINVVARRFPHYLREGEKHAGTIRINNQGYIWFYNSDDESSGFQDLETLKKVFLEVKTEGYILYICPDSEAPQELVTKIREIAKSSGIQKVTIF